MPYSRIMLGMSTYLLAMTISASASAQGNSSTVDNSAAPRVEFLPYSDGVSATIPVAQDYTTTWVFLEPVSKVLFSDTKHYEPIYPTSYEFTIMPPSGAPPTTMTAVTRTKKLAFKLVPGPQERAVQMVIFFDPMSTRAWPTATDKPVISPMQRYQKVAENMADGWVFRPAKQGTYSMGEWQIKASVSPQLREGTEWRFRVIFEGEGRAFPVGELLAFAHENAKEPLEAYVYWDKAGKPAEITRGDKVTASVIVVNGGEDFGDRMVLRLTPSLPYAATASWRWGPDGPEEIELPPSPPNEGRIAIQVQSIAGAIGMTDSAGRSEFASMWGVGVRGVYGVTKMISIDGTLVVLPASTVQFNDGSTVETMVRRGIFRVVLQGGDTTVPYFGAGIGAHFSTYQYENNSELRNGGLFSFGGGIDRWMTKNLVTGLSIQYVGPIGGDGPSSVEAGLHVGYAWKPNSASSQ